MSILVTGGAGYIGSHVCMELLSAGEDVVVVDNLSNSSADSIKRIEEYTAKKITFIEGDVRDNSILCRVFENNEIDAVMHFAALKAVGESVREPLAYYENNVAGTITLLRIMEEFNCFNLVFSSSATVYGDPEKVPITEEASTGGCTNPYGKTKFMMEEILRDIQAAKPEWNITLLRYFNPIGAHPSGVIGENPNGTPNNLMPYITKVACGVQPCLFVFGNDYPTPDGTGIRDYIHVVDLAKAHVMALKKLRGQAGLHIFNLGTGRGVSVLELVRTFEHVNKIKIPYVISGRRAGDIAECFCDASKAQAELGWRAELSVEDMCRDAWNWEKNLQRGKV